MIEMPYHSYYILLFKQIFLGFLLLTTSFNRANRDKKRVKHHSAPCSIFASLVQNIKQYAHYPAFQRLFFFSYLIPNISRRSRDSESQSAERKRAREPLSTVSTVYFILGILRTDLWIGQGTSRLTGGYQTQKKLKVVKADCLIYIGLIELDPRAQLLERRITLSSG